MHKRQLVASLQNYLARDRIEWRGQRAFARFLIHYLENLSIPSDEKYDFWEIDPYLPELLVDAFEKLRTGTDESAVKFRKEYEEETEHEVPNITDLGASNILHQSSAIQTTLGFMLKEVMEDEWIPSHIDAYCKAQQYVIQQTFDKFTRLVYRKGLGEMVDKAKDRGMSGKFGRTELRTFVLAGRIMFTFARRINKKKKVVYRQDGETYLNEWMVSFVGEESDPLLLSAGIQSVYCNFRTALNLMEDVIRHWPKDPKEQKRLFKPDRKVSLA